MKAAMNFLGFKDPCDFEIRLSPAVQGRPLKTVRLSYNRGQEDLMVFQGNEAVRGEVVVIPRQTRVEHVGLKIELVGRIERLDKSKRPVEFTYLVRELDSAGIIFGEKTYSFDLSAADKPFDSYYGTDVMLQYFVRVTATRSSGSRLTKKQSFFVQNIANQPEINESIRMEVGIEDCLHLEFEYSKSKYHLKDSVIGKVIFFLVRFTIKYMELSIVRREIIGSGDTANTVNETIAKHEIMDGCPVRGESIPVRFFLGEIPLTPTYVDINNIFSVKYFLNLVLLDQQDRRYFKQQEITVYAKSVDE